MILRLRDFKGTLPGRSKRLLPENMAQVATNCKLESGEIRPFRSLLRVNTPTKIGTKLSIYRWNSRTNQDANGTIGGATQTNPVRITSPNHGRTTGERIYISGVSGMTQINHRTFTITVVDADTYSLNGEDGTAYPAYAGGGTWVKENGYWFHWTKDVDVARSPIAGDTNERTVFTGDDYPRITDASIAMAGGGTDYPTNSYQLGIPRPANKPSVRAVDIESPVLDLYSGLNIVSDPRPGGVTVREKALVYTDDTRGMKTGEKASFKGVEGTDFVNNNQFTVTILSGNVIGATKTNPVTITLDDDLPLLGRVSGGGLADGDKIKISDVGGMTQLNGNTYSISLIKKTVSSISFGTGVATLTINSHGLSVGERIIWFVGTWRNASGSFYSNLGWKIYTVSEVVDANKIKINTTFWFSDVYLGDGYVVPLRKVNLQVDGTAFDDFLYAGTWELRNKFLLDDTEGMGRVLSGSVNKSAYQKARVTIANHGLNTGNKVILIRYLMFWMGPYSVTKVDDNNFDLDGTESDPSSYSEGCTVSLAWLNGGLWKRIFIQTELIGRNFVMTYVSGWNEEGPPSESSDTLEMGDGQEVEISNLPAVPSGNYNIVAKRLYVTDPGLGSDSYRLFATLPAASTSYIGIVRSDDLGDAIESDEWAEPVADLHSVRMMENGIMVGMSKNDVYFCEPNLPHAWPGPYRKTLPHNGITLGVAGNTAVALTESGVVLITGNHPSQMAERDLKLNQVCVSKRGVAAVGTSGVIFPSPDGLVLVGIVGNRIVTEGHMTRDEWQELNPESIVGTVWEDRYFGFYTKKDGSQGGFIFDPKQPEIGLTFVDISATAVYNDPVSDTLYLMVGDHIEAWDRGSSYLPYTWKSKEVETPRPLVWGVAQVIAADYMDITFKLYRDGVLAYTKVVTSETAFSLPGGNKGRRWEVEVTGTSAVQEILLAESRTELRKVN